MGSIHITGTTPILEQIVCVPKEELRQGATDHDAWTAVEEELGGLLEGVAAANLVRRHRLGKAALIAYSASQLVRNPEFANLILHVENLKRLRRRGPRKPADPQPETPSNVPATPGNAPTPQTTTPPKQQ